MSNQKIYLHFDILVDIKYIPSTFSQQTVAIQIVSPEVSKLNRSLLNKNLVTFHPTMSYIG